MGHDQRMMSPEAATGPHDLQSVVGVFQLRVVIDLVLSLKSLLLRFGLIGSIVVAGFLPVLVASQAKAQATMVDLMLVLAVDASGSVNATEYRLQLDGIAGAFRDGEIVDAIGNGIHGRIAVALLIWGDSADTKDRSPWYVIGSAYEAEQFASRVESYPRRIRPGATGIGSGIAVAIQMLEYADVTALRRVIDVSGDGPETPPDPTLLDFAVMVGRARAMADDRGIVINGLAILNDVANLDEYYRREVRTGPGSFVMKANQYKDFAEAMRAKILREVEEGPPVTWYDGGQSSSPGSVIR